MSWRRICLRHVETGMALSDDWRPTASPEEIQEANRELERRGIPYRWQPDEPSLPFRQPLLS